MSLHVIWTRTVRNQSNPDMIDIASSTHNLNGLLGYVVSTATSTAYHEHSMVCISILQQLQCT